MPTPTRQISDDYDGLMHFAPSLGAAVARAAALLEARGGAEALGALSAIDVDLVADYQPYWAVRAAALAEQGSINDARSAYERAMGLTEDPAVRAFLAARRSACEREASSATTAVSFRHGVA